VKRRKKKKKPRFCPQGKEGKKSRHLVLMLRFKTSKCGLGRSFSSFWPEKRGNLFFKEEGNEEKKNGRQLHLS